MFLCIKIFFFSISSILSIPMMLIGITGGYFPAICRVCFNQQLLNKAIAIKKEETQYQGTSHNRDTHKDQFSTSFNYQV